MQEDNEYYDVTIEVGKDPNNDNGVLSHIKLPNISPEIFKIILRYIYGGIISLNRQEPSDILNTLVAADELHLKELVNYLQNYLIENNSEWLEQHFELTHRTSFQSNSLSELQNFCTNLMAESPDKIFKSIDFTSLPEKSLISLIKRDDLHMREVEVWEHVLKWGLAQNPTLVSDPKAWSDDDFKSMKNTLQNSLPLIRFFSLSSKELSQKVRPYQKLLNQQLYEDLVDSYMDPDSVSTDNILLPRNIEIIDSKIVNLIKGTEEIVGGYNPLRWESSSSWENSTYALNYYSRNGPRFGNDINIENPNSQNENYNRIFCKKHHYKKKIRDSEEDFSIEDYEVFQIIKC
ncbi:BTB/POZ protein [Rhizophagus irregularis DAOM 181602=DAOM 197198]|nr:BTB/POZ protein [Rhizophagus irregularis DAOM 181602=DAOM 197198]